MVIATRDALEDDTVVALELGEPLWRYAVDPVDLTGLEVRQLDGRVGNLNEPDPVEIREALIGSPVVGIRLQDDALVG